MNHSTAAKFANDGLKVLRPRGFPKGKLLVRYSDAPTAYMLKAANVLKLFHPDMVQLTCSAHGLRHFAEDNRAKFLQVSQILGCHHGNKDNVTGFCVCEQGWTSAPFDHGHSHPGGIRYQMCNIELQPLEQLGSTLRQNRFIRQAVTFTTTG
uniref:DUF659 domain-containing protein n=1 Tax=Timema bartmani TaxID=61472 RepID=A0A7R9EVF1_9NEOP|nr:unnamed protein product [Timema bartmani]